MNARPMSRLSFPWQWLVMVGAVGFLAGCEAKQNCYDGGTLASKLQREKALKEELANIPKAPKPGWTPPANLPPDYQFQQPGSLPRKAVRAEAGPAGPFPPFTGIPNSSKGTFLSQVTVSFSELDGLNIGESAGGLRFVQPEWKNGIGRERFLGARPDESIYGMKVFMGDPDGTEFSVIRDFPGAYLVDLQIEQTADFLIFRARATPDPVVPGGWTLVFVENSPVDPAPFNLAVGLSQVEEGGAFYFHGFAVEGEGIGGESEGPIVLKLRDSVEAFQSASGKITAAVQDLPGALTDLDAAIEAHGVALTLLKIAMVDKTLQKGSTSVAARKTLEKMPKDLAAIRLGVATLDPKMAKPQVAKIDKALRTEQGVMSNLLGWKAPPIGKIPQDIFSLRVP